MISNRSPDVQYANAPENPADCKVGDGTECSECNTIDPGEDTPEPYGIIFPEKESDECLYAPDIQVVYPPESKSIDQTFQKKQRCK